MKATTIYIENCTGIIGEVEVAGTNGGGSENTGEIGSWTPVPEPSYPTGGGGGGGTVSQQDDLNYSKFGPSKINTYTMNNQEVLSKIIEWYKWICENKEFVTPSVEMMVSIKNLNTSGPVGIVENGSGTIAGVYVRWQIQAVSGGFAEKGLNDNLEFLTSDEPPSYYRAQLNYYGQHDEPRITLVFNTAADRSKILKNIPCVWH